MTSKDICELFDRLPEAMQCAMLFLLQTYVKLEKE